MLGKVISVPTQQNDPRSSTSRRGGHFFLVENTGVLVVFLEEQLGGGSFTVMWLLGQVTVGSATPAALIDNPTIFGFKSICWQSPLFCRRS